jgi:hypothetical protein
MENFMSQSGSYVIERGGLPVVQTLTGNSGGAVGADSSENINIVGASGIIVTGNPATHTLTVSGTGATYLTYTQVSTTPFTVTTAMDYLGVVTSSLAITLKFPNSASTGQVFYVKDKSGDAATNNITVTTVGGAVLIDGATTFVMNTNYESIALIWNGTSYEIF